MSWFPAIFQSTWLEKHPIFVVHRLSALHVATLHYLFQPIRPTDKTGLRVLTNITHRPRVTLAIRKSLASSGTPVVSWFLSICVVALQAMLELWSYVAAAQRFKWSCPIQLHAASFVSYSACPFNSIIRRIRKKYFYFYQKKKHAHLGVFAVGNHCRSPISSRL